MIRVTFSLRTFIYTKVDPQEAAKKEMARLDVDANDLQRFASSGELAVAPERRSEFYTNQEGENRRCRRGLFLQESLFASSFPRFCVFRLGIISIR